MWGALRESGKDGFYRKGAEKAKKKIGNGGFETRPLRLFKILFPGFLSSFLCVFAVHLFMS
jgi:hypothetical protein